MCTALNFSTKDHYFGRTLDLDRSYDEEVCIIPRNFPLEFRLKETITTHYAMIGMATVVNSMPLIYDATNEQGLSMAGLNFPDDAHYFEKHTEKDNITPFEFVPWILGKCKNVPQARELVSNINLVNIPFSEQIPLSPLHWIISDKNQSIVVESMKDGLHIYENPTGVMANNPPFEYQLFNLNNYRNLNIQNGDNNFAKDLELVNYCQGLGAIGLPGDVSSMSRFVRAVFVKENAFCEKDENSSVGQFFHLLSFVEKPRGICKIPSGEYAITVYTSCTNTDKGLYYYTTYSNRQINCVNMYNTDLESDKISRFPLNITEQINYHN